ncbi:MAG: flagellar hook-associated protein FlgK [Nitrospinae bacterium]|nr:flagellar hook-associated protein FlgK [Nitrospinota bacterium]
MNIYGVMNTAGNALAASQTSMGVVGNNIANINNPAYNQETAVLTAGPTQNFGPYSVGTGVVVSSVTRSFDNYLFGQSLDNNSTTSLWNTKSQLMNQVDTVMNDTSGAGLGNALGNFFQSWQTLTTNPGGATERQAVASAANTLAGQVSNAAAQLEVIQGNANQNIAAAIPQINGYASQIAKLNALISTTEINGNKANDYRDQRDGLLKSLSNLVGVSYFEQSNGQDIVMLKNGSPLVDGQNSYDLSAGLSPANPRVSSIYWNAPDGTRRDITDRITWGQVGAWVQTRDTDVQNVLNGLDSLAGSVVEQVNNLHVTGYGLDGSTGLNFFNPPAPGGFGALSNAGNGTITGTLLNPANADLDHYKLSFDGTSYSVSNIDKGGTAALGGATLASVQGFFRQRGYSIALTGTPRAGDSFTVSAVNNAATQMSVNPAIRNDPNKIAAGTTTQAGDGGLARQIGDIQNRTVMGGAWSPSGATGSTGLYTIGDYYGSLVGTVGTSTKNATDNLTLNQNVGTQISNMVQQVSGVNMDEQMINLVKYQNSYEGAAKTLTTVSQMLQTLMNMI